jgi:mannose-6-phosphate isomerase-like protein (cupin superfamily)
MKTCAVPALAALVLGLNAGGVRAADDNPAAAAPTTQITAPGEGRTFSGGGGLNRVLADLAPGQPRSFAVIDATVPAGYVTPWPMHFHMHYDEFSYVLDGVFITDMPDGSQRKVPPGSATYAPRTHPHHFSNPSQTPVRLLSVATADEIISFKDAWRYADDKEKLADYLATTGTYFLADPVRAKAAGAQPAKTGSIIVLPTEGRTFTAGGGAKVRMLADVPPGEARSFAVMHATYPAGYKGWPAYYSCQFDEFWYVLEGRVAVDVGGQERIVSAGTAVYSPRGALHRLSVPGSKPAKVFAVVTAGQLAAIEGASRIDNDPAKLRAHLAKSQIYLSDQPDACAKAP